MNCARKLQFIDTAIEVKIAERLWSGLSHLVGFG